MNTIANFTPDQLYEIVYHLNRQSEFSSRSQVMKFLLQLDNRYVVQYFLDIINHENIYADDPGHWDLYIEEIPKFMYYEDMRVRHLIKWGKRYHQHVFKTQISKELVATVMHPCRIQAQMEQFDDIESYFEMMGC